jgi:pre-mRNA-splicing factor ATP-dependent RNA helicase DHX15/PRP43
MERKRRIDLSDDLLPRAQRVSPLTGRPLTSRYFDLLETRKTLPVYEHRDKFLELVKANQAIVLLGETGSGKTTQMPQFLVDGGFAMGRKCVACTQPRRVAAMSVSKRVAEEMDVTLGEEVGYTIRFEDVSGPKTVLKFAPPQPPPSH